MRKSPRVLLLITCLTAVAPASAAEPPLSPLLRLAQATLDGRGVAASRQAACRAAQAEAELSCLPIGRVGAARGECRCTQAAGGWTCEATAECVPKW